MPMTSNGPRRGSSAPGRLLRNLAVLIWAAGPAWGAPAGVDFDQAGGSLPALVGGMKDAAVRSPLPVPPARAVASRNADGWTAGSFRSADGASIQYKFRLAPGAGSATVFVGGLTLQETFETLFAGPGRPKTHQFFVWLRGHPPTRWSYTRRLLEADARDLARMINVAASRSGSGRVNLALHSYATLAFQRMVQLADDADADAALSRLSGGQVLFLNGTTRCEGGEDVLGWQGALIAKNVKMFEDWLDTGDATGEAMAAAAELNPLLRPQVAASLAAWKVQRTAALAAGTLQAGRLAVKDLEAPWDGADDGIRRGLLRVVERNVRDPGWQEALMKRSNDTAQLLFRAADVAALRRRGIRLDLVHAAQDQLIPWSWARLTMRFFGIPAPESLPAPGTVLHDAGGRFSFTVVAGDHYFPLKRPSELGLLLRD